MACAISSNGKTRVGDSPQSHPPGHIPDKTENHSVPMVKADGGKYCRITRHLLERQLVTAWRLQVYFYSRYLIKPWECACETLFLYDRL